MIITTKYEYGFTHSMASRKRNGLMDCGHGMPCPYVGGEHGDYFVISESM